MNKINLVVFLIAGLQVAGIEMWKNNYDKSLDFTCSSGDSISMIRSKHDNVCEDRIWDFSCWQSFDSSPECFWTNYVNWFDEEFTFSCPINSIISGMASDHENYYEDRRWKFRCCRVNHYCNDKCLWTPYVNNFDEEFTWHVPHLNYLAGVGSYHDNKYEDRRWKFQYCTRRSCDPIHEWL